jgi:hypothetical protein
VRRPLRHLRNKIQPSASSYQLSEKSWKLTLKAESAFP